MREKNEAANRYSDGYFVALRLRRADNLLDYQPVDDRLRWGSKIYEFEREKSL